METIAIEIAQPKRPRSRSASAPNAEYYWLCDRCALLVTLSYEEGRGLVAVPRIAISRKAPSAVLGTQRQGMAKIVG